ncbi:hypothetical protein AUK10_04125 [Candidatus Gracilibacteria bacterium CG2_30_37_12]|nr:MAG: hypothetical protein AUK10_04125 [Candidatus Gracilibacteria bacterium CG2_30_37_12]
MKTLRINHLGNKSLNQCPRITVKSLYKEVEERLREELLKIRLNGIEIVYSKGSYGGYRKWFKCPLCSCKVFILYDIGGNLKCRKCSGLYYKSQKLDRILKEKCIKDNKLA